MISQVRDIVDLIAVHLGTNGSKFPIVRKEQTAKKPAYPFGAYKILSVNGNQWNNKVQVDNPDPTKVTERYSKVNTAVVSLSFYISENIQGLSESPIDVIHELAQRAIDFLQVIGHDSLATLEVVVELLNSNVSDRTTYLDPIYEYQVGFDFQVKMMATLNKTLDAVDMDATFAGIIMNFE